MTGRILIIGTPPETGPALEKARALGLEAFELPVSPEAAAGAPVSVAERIMRVAGEHAVAGLFCASEAAVEATARAAWLLGLPGHAPEAARHLRDKGAMRRALDRAGLANPRYIAARTCEEAEPGAHALGAPVIVKPIDGSGSRGVCRVDYLDDLPLAVLKAQKHSTAGSVLVEEYLSGPEYRVEGFASASGFHAAGLSGCEISPAPCRYDIEAHTPPALSEARRAELIEAAGDAVAAMGRLHGALHIELIRTEAGPRIVEVADGSGAGPEFRALYRAATGADLLADALRAAMGTAPEGKWAPRRAVALRWLESHAGHVTAVEGEHEARSLPCVEEVVVRAAVGAQLSHAVDRPSRDALGYVIASADSLETARSAASRAADLCRIFTQSVVQHG